MKKVIFISVVLLLSNLSFAQHEDVKEEVLNHGVQFQVRGLYDVTNFNGFTFCYRYQIDKKSGLRIGLLTDIFNRTSDLTHQRDSVAKVLPDNTKNQLLKLSAVYIHSIAKYADFSLIVGCGPFISYRKIESESGILYYSSTQIMKRTDKTIGYGVDLLIGVEYGLFDNVLITGEYGVSFNFENYETNLERTEITDFDTNFSKISGDGNDFAIMKSGVFLGLAIFF